LAKRKFKAESKRLLDLMINSIYTHHEIFLRELVSNASDAIDKIYYKTMTDEGLEFNREDYFITIDFDKDQRLLKVTDSGIGMSKEDLENNLGVIASSGSLQFKNENEMKDGIDIIGQFGVGFYSAFMVAEKVTVISKAFGSDEAFMWESTGADGYSIKTCEKEDVGTEIILNIKESTDDVNYDDYLSEYTLKTIIKKYSDFIRYPINMNVSKSRLKEGAEDEYESYEEIETVNSMVPIWKKNKSELEDEDYKNFYSEKHYGFDDPIKYIHYKAEGTVSFNALLYVPEKMPFDYYTPDYEKGLELYSSGVMIMGKCPDLLPDYFSFVKGVVDSEDLSLNISREMLQHDRQLKLIAKNLKSKIKKELESLLDMDREAYEKFFESFGRQLKYGVYSDYGVNKGDLQDLLMFYSSTEKKLVTLKEYVARMRPDQTQIFYASGDSIERIDKMPQTEMAKDQGFEILYFTDEVDEFAIRILMNYDEKEFKSVSSSDLDFKSDDAPSEEEEKEYGVLFDKMKELLDGKVKDVRISKRLKTHPVCLSNEGELSIEMEKVLSAMPNGQEVKAEKILEINIHHEMFKTLEKAFEEGDERIKTVVDVLYNQALLIEGLPIEDPVEYANSIWKLFK
jgi:molecular chaperone HtpG